VGLEPPLDLNTNTLTISPSAALDLEVVLPNTKTNFGKFMNGFIAPIHTHTRTCADI